MVARRKETINERLDKVWVVLGVYKLASEPWECRLAEEVIAKNWGEAINMAREAWRDADSVHYKEILVAGVVCGRTDEETKALSVF